MRERSVAINIRVTESEKKKLERAAKSCGLSLSAYLRKLGLGKEVQAISPPDFYEAYRQLKSLREQRKTLSEGEIERGFDEVIQSFLRAYHAINGSETPWQ